MLESFTAEFAATDLLLHRAHVGVTGSGDLEVLLEPAHNATASFAVTTNVAGHRLTWLAVLTRFVVRHPYRMHVEIHDTGATPGTVLLRLEQALEAALQKATL